MTRLVLLAGEESNDDEEDVAASTKLWQAVKIIAIADAVMSLDNVIAIAMAARGSYALLMFGLAVSIPLIMAGAALIMALLERFPIIIWAGAALLGWIAGEIIAKDPLITGALDPAMAHSAWMVGARWVRSSCWPSVCGGGEWSGAGLTRCNRSLARCTT
jgi:predicted tellurium resistance membrane protein TerC